MKKKWKEILLKGKVLVVDTGVLIEYLDLSSPLAPKIEKLYNKSLKDEINLYTTSLVIAETLYISARFYRVMGVEDPNRRAHEYIIWLKNYVKLKAVDIDNNLAEEMGELKKKLRIALVDCSVIALAKRINGMPLFRRIEREMVPVLSELRKLGTLFIDEIEL